MKTAEDIESFLIRMESPYEPVGPNIWVIKDQGPDIVVSIVEPVVVFRVKLIEKNKIPDNQRERFYETLLGLNASEMLHGAYGLEEGAVVATDALQLENVDFNEFQATMEELSLTVSRHYPLLAKLAGA